MAQVFLTASDYDDGDTLGSIGFVELGAGIDSAKATNGGVEYFNIQTTFSQPRNEVLDNTAGAGDQEVLLMYDAPLSSYIAPSNTAFIGIALRDTIGLRAEIKTTTSVFVGNNISGSTTVAPPLHDNTKALAMRFQVVGDTYRAKVWQADAGTLIANEPVGWMWEATLATPATGRAGVHKYTSQYRLTHIGIGTGVGVSAPDSAPSAPIVATPTPLPADQITANSARVRWSV